MDMEQGSQRVLNMAWDMEKDGSLTVVEDQPLARAAIPPSPTRGVETREDAGDA